MFLLRRVRTFIIPSFFISNKFDVIFASFFIKLEHCIIDLIWFCKKSSEGVTA